AVVEHDVRAGRDGRDPEREQVGQQVLLTECEHLPVVGRVGPRRGGRGAGRVVVTAARDEGGRGPDRGGAPEQREEAASVQAGGGAHRTSSSLSASQSRLTSRQRSSV